MRFLIRAVERHHFETRFRRNVRNTSPHQTCAEDANFLNFDRRNILRATRALFSGLLIHEQRADHVLRNRIGEKRQEVFRLDLHSLGHGQLRAFIEARHNGFDGREVVLGFRQRHGVGCGKELHRFRVHRAGTARDFEALNVPRLKRAFLSVLFDPGCCGPDGCAGFYDVIDEALHLRFFGVEVCTRCDHLRGVLQTDEARDALCPATAGEEANEDFRKAKLHLRAVSGNAVVARKSQLQTAA